VLPTDPVFAIVPIFVRVRVRVQRADTTVTTPHNETGACAEVDSGGVARDKVWHR